MWDFSSQQSQQKKTSLSYSAFHKKNSWQKQTRQTDQIKHNYRIIRTVPFLACNTDRFFIVLSSNDHWSKLCWWLFINLCYTKQNYIRIVRRDGHAIFIQYSAYLFPFCGKYLAICMSSFQITRSSCFYYHCGTVLKTSPKDTDSSIWNAEVCVWSVTVGFLPVTFLPHSCHRYYFPLVSLHLSIWKWPLLLFSLLLIRYHPLPSSAMCYSFSHSPLWPFHLIT